MSALPAIGLALALLNLFGPPGERHITIAGWRLDVRADRFTDRRTCRLHRGAALYQRRAVVFRLSHGADTSEAAYRVDGGQLYFAATDAARLAALGFALHDDDLANPSGGLVRVPVERLASAKRVTIERTAYSRKVTFTVAGLDQALAAARATCKEDEFSA